MMTRILPSLLAGATLMLAGTSAHAFCIDTSIGPQNDVGLMGCAATGPGGQLACDMNGIQERWATHGVVAILPEEARIYSWTRNTLEVTEEWTCRIEVTGASDGAVHTFSGMAGVAKTYATFECRILPECGPL